MRVLIVALALVPSLPLGDDPLTPTHKRILSEVRSLARDASLRAEGELVQIFEHEEFRLGLRLEGAQDLMGMSSGMLLQKLQENLPFVEYTNNFGLDAMSRKLHPGNTAMDLDTIDTYGHIPTAWELKLHKSPLAENVSQAQWKIFDAAETGLYPFPEFANPDKPTAEEILERPKYLGANLRRMDLALQRYGAFVAVARNDVVRDRSIFLPADSGGWENVCNNSITPIDPADRNWEHHMMVPCEPIFARGNARPVLGVADHQLHTILANSNTFDRVGGNLARVLHQFLTPNASVRPIEVNMYTEQTFMGPLRMVDLKLLVASFPGIFGTPEGDNVRAFCKRHGVPLAWGLGSGRMWPDEETRKGLLIPYEPFYTWKAGRARLLDPVAGWQATNVTAPSDSEGVWEKLWAEVVESRQKHTSISGPGQEAFEAWWNKLVEATGSVPPLRAGDCASADLCFGTYQMKGHAAKECVCRLDPASKTMVV